MAPTRRHGAASAAVLIGLTAGSLGAHVAAPEWSRRAGLDVWNYAALDRQRQQAAAERAETVAKGERNARRRAAADALAAQLIAGSATLADTATGLHDLFADDAGMQTALEAYCPNARDPRLLFARHAIHRAERRLRDDPSRWADLAGRLEAEYRALDAAWGRPAAK